MTDNKTNCPLCHSVVRYFGEGGYGKCTNNTCTFEQKIEGCDTKPCEDINLRDNKDLHTASD